MSADIWEEADPCYYLPVGVMDNPSEKVIVEEWCEGQVAAVGDTTKEEWIVADAMGPPPA